jgi:uncharacterized protein (UPF0261 family)
MVILGTLDTKGDEIRFMKRLMESKGHMATIVDVGPLGPPVADPDISNEKVARWGGRELQGLLQTAERGQMMKVMGEGAGRCLLDLYRTHRLDGVIAIGGNQGTAIASIAMRALPIGFPKFMVSTVASGNIRPYVEDKDIGVVFSVADLIGGPNPVSRSILANAVAALVGMVENGARVTSKPGERTIAVTALGNTEPAVRQAMKLLREADFQVIAFHASGAGGSAMEELIEQGIIHGVLDLTPHELAEEVVGAGAYVPVRPGRLKSAGAKGIPQVISTGAMEYLCFGPWESIPIRLRKRKIYMHNPYNANLGVSTKEMARVGQTMAERLNGAKGPTAVIIPLRGWSVYGAPGGPLHDPLAYKSFLKALRSRLHANIQYREVDAHINDERFVDLCVKQLKEFMETQEVPKMPKVP